MGSEPRVSEKAALSIRLAFLLKVSCILPHVSPVGVDDDPPLDLGPFGGKGSPESAISGANQWAYEIGLARKQLRNLSFGRANENIFRDGFDIPSEAFDESLTAISFHTGHDANIALGRNGRVQCVLELERLFEDRYFQPGLDRNVYREQWALALRFVRDHCECETGLCPTSFDIGVIVDVDNFGADLLPGIVQEVFDVKRWRAVHHHEAHALLGFHASPFRSALIVSYDGGGGDGSYNVFLGKGLRIHRVAQLPYRMGVLYISIAGLMPEVTNVADALKVLCNDLRTLDLSSDVWIPVQVQRKIKDTHSDAGKIMGYSATGTASNELNAAMRRYLEAHMKNPHPGGGLMPSKILETACESVDGQRAVAASLQEEYDRMNYAIVARLLHRLPSTQTVEGIVMTGGCALNVLTNQLIRDKLTLAGTRTTDLQKNAYLNPLDLYVPPAPNDAGLSVGGLWAVMPPSARQPLQYLGFRLFDEHILERVAGERGAKRLTELGGTEFLADLLVGDAHSVTARPIVAVVRGRQEFGPRALGHRSLFAVPDSVITRERLNRLKARRWYRPVAPIIAEESLVQVFGESVRSPYMELAPYVLKDVQSQFPALAHLDGTARHQSVSAKDEPWIHDLLLAVGRRTGLAALINTSFNSKGKPIVNTVRQSLNMLDELPDLDYLLIEDWLFQAPPKEQAASGTEEASLGQSVKRAV